MGESTIGGSTVYVILYRLPTVFAVWHRLRTNSYGIWDLFHVQIIIYFIFIVCCVVLFVTAPAGSCMKFLLKLHVYF